MAQEMRWALVWISENPAAFFLLYFFDSENKHTKEHDNTDQVLHKKTILNENFIRPVALLFKATQRDRFLEETFVL